MGSAIGKNHCNLPHSLSCPGGIEESDSWRACPLGYIFHGQVVPESGFADTLDMNGFMSSTPDTGEQPQLPPDVQNQYLRQVDLSQAAGPLFTAVTVSSPLMAGQTLAQVTTTAPVQSLPSAQYPVTVTASNTTTTASSSVSSHLQATPSQPTPAAPFQTYSTPSQSQHQLEYDMLRLSLQQLGEGARPKTTEAPQNLPITEVSSNVQHQVDSLRAANQQASQSNAHPGLTIANLRMMPELQALVEDQWQHLRSSLPALSAARSAHAQGISPVQPQQPPATGSDLQQQQPQAVAPLQVLNPHPQQQPQQSHQQAGIANSGQQFQHPTTPATGLLYQLHSGATPSAQPAAANSLPRVGQPGQNAQHYQQPPSSFTNGVYVHQQQAGVVTPGQQYQQPTIPAPVLHHQQRSVATHSAQHVAASSLPKVGQPTVPRMAPVYGSAMTSNPGLASHLPSAPAMGAQNLHYSGGNHHQVSGVQQHQGTQGGQYPQPGGVTPQHGPDQALYTLEFRCSPSSGRTFQVAVPVQPKPTASVQVQYEWHCDPQTGRTFQVPQLPSPQLQQPVPAQAPGYQPPQQGIPWGQPPPVQTPQTLFQQQLLQASPADAHDRLRGITPIGDGGATKKAVKVIDFAKKCPVKWAKLAKPETINLPLYSYGAVTELEAALSGRGDALSDGVFLAKLRHLKNTLEVCCLSSSSTEFSSYSYGWHIARDYAMKVEEEVDQRFVDWQNMAPGIRTQTLVLSQMENPRSSLVKKEDPKVTATKKDRCTTFNTCTTDMKCDYEVSNPGRTCLRKHECNWCRTNLQLGYKHQELKCLKKQAASK